MIEAPVSAPRPVVGRPPSGRAGPATASSGFRGTLWKPVGTGRGRGLAGSRGRLWASRADAASRQSQRRACHGGPCPAQASPARARAPAPWTQVRRLQGSERLLPSRWNHVGPGLCGQHLRRPRPHILEPPWPALGQARPCPGQGCVCMSGSSAEGGPFVDAGGWPLAVCTVPSHHDASAVVREAPAQDRGAMCCFRKELADPPPLFSPS